MTKTPLHIADVLQTAGDVVSQIGWTQKYFAKTEDGLSCEPTDKRADCFCLVGAIQLARSQAGRKYPQHAFIAPVMDMLSRSRATFSVMSWNDSRSRTQKEVAATLYATAESIREQHAK